MASTTLQPCGCCEKTPVDPHVAAFDHHLEAFVCADCRTKLMGAVAWLKRAAGLVHCRKVAKS